VGQPEKGSANENLDTRNKEYHTGNPLELGGQRKWFIHIPKGWGFLAGSRLHRQERNWLQGSTITWKTEAVV
jgi:hypothetical protein